MLKPPGTLVEVLDKIKNPARQGESSHCSRCAFFQTSPVYNQLGHIVQIKVARGDLKRMHTA